MEESDGEIIGPQEEKTRKRNPRGPWGAQPGNVGFPALCLRTPGNKKSRQACRGFSQSGHFTTGSPTFPSIEVCRTEEARRLESYVDICVAANRRSRPGAKPWPPMSFCTPYSNVDQVPSGSNFVPKSTTSIPIAEPSLSCSDTARLATRRNDGTAKKCSRKPGTFPRLARFPVCRRESPGSLKKRKDP